MQHSQEWISRCVWLAGILTLGCGVFGSLWSGLHALGDPAGASGCQGIFWGFVACWSLNGMTLIGLLTANALSSSQLTTKLQPTVSPESPMTTDN